MWILTPSRCRILLLETQEVIMPAAIVARTDTSFTIQLEISYASSMLDFEEAIQQRLNEAGVLATTEALRPLRRRRLAHPGRRHQADQQGQAQVKEYQTPYGVAPVERHVYQSSRGGKTYCPLDRNARIVVQFHPQVRQDGLAQVRRVRIGPGDPRPGREPRAGRSPAASSRTSPMPWPPWRWPGKRTGNTPCPSSDGADLDDHHRHRRDVPA